MLKAMNIFFSKDAQKILQYYDKNSSDKHKIIHRLWEINGISQLCEICKNDSEERENLLRELIKKHKLTIEHFIYILNWLNYSKLLSEIVMYIKARLNNDDIEKIASDKQINPNARKLLETVLLQKSNVNQSRINRYTPDEKYLKLKMILEDSESFISQDLSNIDTYEKNDIFTVVNEFLDSYSPEIKNRLEFVQAFLLEKKCLLPQNFDCLLCILNLIEFTEEEKIKLLVLLKKSECYDPEFLVCYTKFKYLSIETMQTILSMPTIKKWLETFYEFHYYNDLHWLADHFSNFEWIEEICDPIYYEYVYGNVKVVESNMMTTLLKRTLSEIVLNKQILLKLDESSHAIQEFINLNLSQNDFQLDYYLKALLLIGGKSNTFFINELMNRRPVNDVNTAYEEIEKKYLKYKTEIDDADKIEEYIKSELADKSRIIYAGHYGTILQSWLASLSNLKVINEELKSLLLNNLPDIKAYVADANREEKLIICNLIGLLKLTEHRLILENFITSSDLILQIFAVIALRNLGEDVSSYINAFANSKNVLVRQEFSRSLHYFTNDFDQITLVQLAIDDNALVSEYTMNFIASLEKDLALQIFYEIYTKVQNKNRYHLVQLLGRLKTPKAIALIVELLKNGDHRIYNDAIKALINIHHPLSIAVLQNMELNKNFILELERAKALISLGDFKGWNILKKYFNISHAYVQNYAKMIFLELANSEQLKTIRKLVSDQNPMIAGFAMIKIYLNKENEGNILIDSAFEMKDNTKLYYLAILFSHLPYHSIRNKLSLLLYSDSIKCRTIAMLIMAKNGETEHIKKLEKEILSLDEEAQTDIINTLFDFPEKGSFNLLKKVCYFQNPFIIKKALEILPNYFYENVNAFVKDLWNRSENYSKILIIDYIIYSHNEHLYLFIKSQSDYVSFEVQAHIFRSVINIENSEDAWNRLDELIRADERDIKKAAIDALSRIEDQRTINILSRYLNSPFEDIQIEVIKALGNTGNPEVLPLLAKYTESLSPRIKIALAKSLGNLPFKESHNLIVKLLVDRDEYVKVTAEIALEKIEKGSDIKYISFNNILDNILKDNSWKLSEEWFDREYNLFYTQYLNYRIRPIHDFKKKIILDEDDYQKKLLDLKKELEVKLSGNSDIQSIIELKKKNESELLNYMIKEELVISLLLTDGSSLNVEDSQMIYNIIRSKDEILLKSIILNAGKSLSPFWIEFVCVITAEQINASCSDLIIYALSHEFRFKNLETLALLLDHERARFYFLKLFNYFLVNKTQIDKKAIPEVYKNIALSQLEPRLKNLFVTIINTLERM